MNFYFDEGVDSITAQITVEWDANTEPNISGYRVYYGSESGIYDSIVDVGNITNYTIIGLEPGDTYFITATAYDTDGNESDFATELPYTVPSI
jgi:hypothetical protein